MTFQAIADLYGISKARVGQIFAKKERYIKYEPIRREKEAKKIVENDKALHYGDVLALADYLRHKVSVDNPKDQYFVDLAAKMLEDFVKQRKNEQ
jgi:hypothetical protein